MDKQEGKMKEEGRALVFILLEQFNFGNRPAELPSESFILQS